MSSNDSSSDLDSQISAIVESTVGRMRDELMHRMQDTESRLHDIATRMSGDDASAAAATGDETSDLFDAVVAMDRGGSQQEVLAALLQGVGRFAGRSALFLTRADGAQGWGSYGFENSLDDMQEIVLSYSEGPLAVLAEGRGCVPLNADECGDLCRRMGASPGAEGLLVPFVLRDRLAAALYVDRFTDDPPLKRRPLQLLAYVGAQTVEGLALRQRSETPTLQVASEEAAEPGVALWETPAVEQLQAPAPPDADDHEPAMTEPEETVAAPPAEMTLEELAEEDAPPAMASEPMPAAEIEIETAAETEIETAAETEIETAAETEIETAAETEIETAGDDGWDVAAEPIDEPVVEPEPAPEEPAEEPTRPLESLAEPAAEAPAEEAQPRDATAEAGFSTVEVEPPPEPAPVTPPAEVQPSAAGETTEVRPPTDVSGPGWAFTASRAAAETGDDAQHEEARRLARLLVTEIKLYNEEQVEEGRRGNDIYPRLREDIDRSRQIFDERVGDAVSQETDYFHEEMVRILAGGNAEALGI